MEVLENNCQQKWVNTGGYGTDGENCYFYSHLSSGGLKTSTKNRIEPPVIIAFVVVGISRPADFSILVSIQTVTTNKLVS